MLTYIIRRLLLIIPTIFGITLLVFFFLAFAPGGIGGAALQASGGEQSAEGRRVREYYNQRYGLDKPVLVQYGRWLNRMSPLGFATYTSDDPAVIQSRQAAPDSPAVRAGDIRFDRIIFKWPDLGESLIRHRPVMDLVKEALPVTLLLNLVSLPLVYVVGIVSGMIAARRRGQAFDVGWSIFSLALWSIPTIWAGVMLIGFLANRQYIKLFPTSGLASTLAADMPFLPSRAVDGAWQAGWLLDVLWHLALPVLCMTYGGFAMLSKLMRGSILDNLNQDYVRTALAKGLADNAIMYRHVFRNSLLPLITVAAGILPSLLGGSVIVETIFGIPGMGQLTVQAVSYRDRELVLASTFVLGVISLLSLLLRDICYALADPRVSYD